jgi:hypothetical protein
MLIEAAIIGAILTAATVLMSLAFSPHYRFMIRLSGLGFLASSVGMRFLTFAALTLFIFLLGWR